MAKWKLFNRSKTKEEAPVEDKGTKEENKEIDENQLKPETRGKTKEVSIKEYNETLYSKGYAQKQPTSLSHEKRQPVKRTTWENAETIEQNIDSMRMKQSESTSSRTQKGIDTEKKVDFILLKKKK